MNLSRVLHPPILRLASIDAFPALTSLATQMQHAHTAFLCSGAPWPTHGGSWVGHFLPGVFLLAWGLHWFMSSTWQQLTGARTQRTSAAHHRIVLLPWPLQHLEPALKIIFPLIAIILEFTLSGTRCVCVDRQGTAMEAAGTTGGVGV